MEAFRKIFTGLMRAHGCTYVDKKGADGLKIKGKSFVKREPVTDQLWQNHLNGIEPGLGIVPINENNECRWGCIDVDQYTLDYKKIINKLPMGIPLHVCRSKSGGAHIFLFTTDFVPAKLMRDKLMSLSAILGFGNAEVFPKQIELKSQDDTGNFLNLPYFNCKNTTRYCFDSQGKAVTIDVFLNAVEVSALTPKELQDLKIERPKSELSDGPPCLESIIQTDIKDYRDRLIYQYIQYAKRKWPDSWQSKINAFNYKYFAKHPEGPLDDRTIQAKIKSNENKELGFKCKEDPFCNHCDKNLCSRRDYGIKGQVLFPELTNLQKIKLEEPYYFLNIDGERIKLENVDYLLQQRLLKRAIAAQTNKLIPKVTAKEYDKYVQELMSNMEEIDAPEGSSKLEQLKEHLEEWCTDRTAEGATKDDIIFGNVWNNDGHHYFQFTHFFNKFLNRRKWPIKHEETLTWLVQQCNCDQVRIMVGKKKISVLKLEQFKKQQVEIKQKPFKKEDAF